jgi:hypothetical protein
MRHHQLNATILGRFGMFQRTLVRFLGSRRIYSARMLNRFASGACGACNWHCAGVSVLVVIATGIALVYRGILLR